MPLSLAPTLLVRHSIRGGDVVIWRHGTNHENFLSSFPTAAPGTQARSAQELKPMFSMAGFCKSGRAEGATVPPATGSLICLCTVSLAMPRITSIPAPLCAICSVRLFVGPLNNGDGDILAPLQTGRSTACPLLTITRPRFAAAHRPCSLSCQSFDVDKYQMPLMQAVACQVRWSRWR